MGETFRRWRTELNKKYIQKGLTPFNEFGHITPSQWAELVAQKTSPEAMELSARNSEFAKRNVHRHRLGPAGYRGKEKLFRRLEEQAAESEENPLNKVTKRAKRWILGRSDSKSGELKFSNPDTEQVVSKILSYGEEKEKGSFKPSREKDELTMGLGTAEHTGRVRGLGKRTTWKYGFEEDRHIYKKHSVVRESNLEDRVAELVAKALQKEKASAAPTEGEAPKQLALIGSPPDVRSSQASTAGTTAVDRIREPTPCTLVVVSGRLSTVMEVATGVAHPPGGVLHGKNVPSDYTKVEVHTVKPNFTQWPIDHPTPDGQHMLGEVLKQFILWHKKDIVLNVTSPPPIDQDFGMIEEGQILSPVREDEPHSTMMPDIPE